MANLVLVSRALRKATQRAESWSHVDLRTKEDTRVRSFLVLFPGVLPFATTVNLDVNRKSETTFKSVLCHMLSAATKRTGVNQNVRLHHLSLGGSFAKDELALHSWFPNLQTLDIDVREPLNHTVAFQTLLDNLSRLRRFTIRKGPEYRRPSPPLAYQLRLPQNLQVYEDVYSTVYIRASSRQPIDSDQAVGLQSMQIDCVLPSGWNGGFESSMFIHLRHLTLSATIPTQALNVDAILELPVLETLALSCVPINLKPNRLPPIRPNLERFSLQNTKVYKTSSFCSMRCTFRTSMPHAIVNTRPEKARKIHRSTAARHKMRLHTHTIASLTFYAIQMFRLHSLRYKRSAYILCDTNVPLTFARMCICGRLNSDILWFCLGFL
jgi:hypothetical protein